MSVDFVSSQTLASQPQPQPAFTMPWQVTPAIKSDAPRIAQIQLAACTSNTLLQAAFPAPRDPRGLYEVLTELMTKAINDSSKVVYVIRAGGGDGEVISFAMWHLPGCDDAPFDGVHWPKDTNLAILKEYFGKAAEEKDAILGSRACYRLVNICTFPDFQKHGAGTELLRWGMRMSLATGCPIYLECTSESRSVYVRSGFREVKTFSVDVTLGGRMSTYTESCVIYEPIQEDQDENEDEAEYNEWWDSSLSIANLKMDYEVGVKPQELVRGIYDRIEAYTQIQDSVWIHLEPIENVMKAARAIQRRWPNHDERPPLWGIPFSVKDNIDVAGVVTTAGCPALSRVATRSATVVQHCINAGALFVGKTNMEQLATGMTGLRSPFGTLRSSFSKNHIVGGSSSGSAVSVSTQLVSFSIGSDTAGSIRVPALFNGVCGFKPTKGTVSAAGLTPACAHQDCISFLTTNVEDASVVWKVCNRFDKRDSFAKPQIFRQNIRRNPIMNAAPRFRFGIPPQYALDACCPHYGYMFAEAVEKLQEHGGRWVEMDWSPFSAANDLLYSGTFVSERLASLPPGWYEANKQHLHPTILEVFEGVIARNNTAEDVFRDLHKQAECIREVESILTYERGYNMTDREDILTVLIVPTAPIHPTIAEVRASPIALNSQLGAFTHFANVLDLTCISLPCGTYLAEGFVEDGQDVRLPFGVTLVAGRGLDEQLLALAHRIAEELSSSE